MTKILNWGCMFNNAAAGVPRLYVYWNENGDTITTAGYFPATLGIKTGDMVLVVPKDSATAPAWYKLSVAADTGVVTAAAAS